ncbi:hypothetical protein T12_14429 [Trichinella patagoniensis]|uniref:Uncharacterized protein n=1 Tax=Trichinella patagoniensis TaxID=990121 RepID=A0A0V0ZNG9_9BILA|nr:hypothetical protein T12_14429 [Trichinella patagoniensis]
MDIVACSSAIRGPNEDMSSKISCKEITVCSTCSRVLMIAGLRRAVRVRRRFSCDEDHGITFKTFGMRILRNDEVIL